MRQSDTTNATTFLARVRREQRARVRERRMGTRRVGGLTPTPGFVPSDLSVANGGPLSAWLQVASATVTGQGVSSLPDALNANPAVQATDAKRPPQSTSDNGRPIMTFDGGDVLVWPLIAANNTPTAKGFAFWYRPGSVAAGFQLIVSTSAFTGGAANHQQQLYQSASALALDAWFSANVNGRIGTSPSVLVAGVWSFITAEYDSSAATEAARQVITVNGIVRTLAFSSAGAGGSGTLQTTTGNALIGAQSTTPTFPILNASVGPHIYAFNAKMAAATTGLLTPQARVDFMSYNAPT